jgi:hypothetical protein
LNFEGIKERKEMQEPILTRELKAPDWFPATTLETLEDDSGRDGFSSQKAPVARQISPRMPGRF